VEVEEEKKGTKRRRGIKTDGERRRTTQEQNIF
jgi:hypothetical protein